jgi:osmotically-inducible protein OsmY
VDDTQLQVEWWLDRHDTRDTASPVRNDVQIRRAVQDAFLYDPRLRGANVTVHVRKGAVSLLGSVATFSAKQAAGQDAKDTLGVRRVINHLKVDAADWPGDSAVSRRANEALARDAVLARYDVRASSFFGKVFLRGEVNSPFEKQRAAAVVANVPGTLDVVNRIRIDTVWEPKPDNDIREDTLRRMRWSPLLDAEQITVAVSDGVVTLTGNVANYQQRSVAERHARQAGARRVVNHLEVRGDRRVPSDLKANLVPKRRIPIRVDGHPAHRSGEAASRAGERRVERVTAQVKGRTGIENTFVVKKSSAV